MQRKDVLIEALRAAGAEVLKFDPASLGAKVKSTAGDLVTEADLASERVIIEAIGRAFPDDEIISEEATESHAKLAPEKLSNLTAWVIDPIDGTNNFTRNMRYSGISIGYIERGEIALGGIYDPFRQALYVAERGSGASLDGTPIHVSNKTTFDSATRVCTSNSYEGGTAANLARYEKLGHVWVDVLGSAVLIMADVAAGRLDLYHHNGLKPWDNAAGFLIATEAGAKVVSLNGQPTTWLSSEVVMGNPALVDSFVTKTVG